MGANAPSTFISRGGCLVDGAFVATAAVPQCSGVMVDSNGNTVLATSGNRISGVAANNYAVGEVPAIHKGGSKTVLVTGTVVPGDYLQVSSTPGVLQAEGSSGSTANTVDCCGRALTTKDADNLVMMETLE
jgi:Uncharacterized conserved protein (DUF2190)